MPRYRIYRISLIIYALLSLGAIALDQFYRNRLSNLYTYLWLSINGLLILFALISFIILLILIYKKIISLRVFILQSLLLIFIFLLETIIATVRGF